ncbi:hypothetical protein BbuMM1_B260 (plasmid) [Borreliella burgdorferi]|nr:hypothetical protein BbuMM1_B260 [Borreliella burgdorferi]
MKLKGKTIFNVFLEIQNFINSNSIYYHLFYTDIYKIKKSC